MHACVSEAAGENNRVLQQAVLCATESVTFVSLGAGRNKGTFEVGVENKEGVEGYGGPRLL